MNTNNNFKEVDETLLSQLYGFQTAKAMQFLLEHVDEPTMMAFFNRFVNPAFMRAESKARMVVRQTAQGTRLTGNTGHYQIIAMMGDGCEHALHFTNQVSTVYYLMHLIDRRQHEGALPPLSLGGNKRTFVTLYHMAYDNISHDDILLRYERLLYRRDGNHIRVGRQNEIIADIRKQLNALFDAHGESFLPYAMTAKSHLAVEANRIIFEGAAEQLLQLHLN